MAGGPGSHVAMTAIATNTDGTSSWFLGGTCTVRKGKSDSSKVRTVARTRARRARPAATPIDIDLAQQGTRAPGQGSAMGSVLDSWVVWMRFGVYVSGRYTARDSSVWR